jgi:hypothetical protein
MDAAAADRQVADEPNAADLCEIYAAAIRAMKG